ncbi:SDR family oxidoreductase [Candidatus Pacearchaeota archaeon]|nr:SDR family oxidoreductase [Candidatus Pacearchaeota archaeon]
MLLKNKISVISGVGNRFGKAIAYLFAQEGSKIVLISRKSDIIHNIAQDINKQGGEAYSIVCDMTNGEEASKAFLNIIKKYAKIDILVNNVGGNYSKKKTLKDMDSDMWDVIITNNLTSLFLASKNFIKNVQDGGSIINIACAYKTLLDGNIAYATAKSGVVGFTKNLARESREDNIRVNCILPGVIRNNFDKENLSTISKTIKRKGNSEDVAFAALFFASDRSSWITGQTIVVDGGEELFLEMEKV